MTENNPQIPTLYEWAGGFETFERLVKTFYELTLQDDLLKAFFEKMPDSHKHNVALWLIEVLAVQKSIPRSMGDEWSCAHDSPAPRFEFTEEARVRWIQLMQKAADIEKLPS